MYQINDDIPLGCVYESQDGSTKYCPMLNHDDVPYCQWFEDEPEAAIGIDERPVYCPILPSVQPEIVRCKDCKYNVSSHKCLHPESFFLVPDDDFIVGMQKREPMGEKTSEYIFRDRDIEICVCYL